MKTYIRPQGVLRVQIEIGHSDRCLGSEFDYVRPVGRPPKRAVTSRSLSRRYSTLMLHSCIVTTPPAIGAWKSDRNLSPLSFHHAIFPFFLVLEFGQRLIISSC